MTLPFKEGDAISIQELRRWERQVQDERLMAAVKRARDGETDWESLTYMMGRDELPDLLPFVWKRLPQDQLIVAVGDAWVGAEVPERRLPRRDWLPMFRAAGYRGPISFEYNFAETDEREGTREGLAYLKELVATT